MLRRTKSTLGSIRNLTELAQVKFNDKAFSEFFYQSVTKDIGKANLLLEGLIQYLLVNTPLKKKDTVHRLIEEVLKKYHVQLEEKGIQLSQKYERDLPEAIVPDEPLRYILSSILQYGVKAVIPNGAMEFLTRSFLLQREEGTGQTGLRKDQRCIEIKVVFTAAKKREGQFEESPVVHKEEPLNLILRLAEEVVRKNRGVMKFETDVKKGEKFISIRFPSERREIAQYQPIHQLMN